MVYDLLWKCDAEEDFANLDKAIQKQVVIQFKKLISSPELGKTLGKKAGFDLTGYLKLYFYQKKYRIVYKLDEKNKKVIIFAIGNREGMEVYREMVRRLEKTH